MMEVQLLEGFHAWRGRMRFSSQWVWKRGEFQGTNSKPKATAAPRREQKPEPHPLKLGVITDHLQPKANHADLGETLWVTAACEQCVSTVSKNATEWNTAKKRANGKKRKNGARWKCTEFFNKTRTGQHERSKNIPKEPQRQCQETNTG